MLPSGGNELPPPPVSVTVAVQVELAPIERVAGLQDTVVDVVRGPELVGGTCTVTVAVGPAGVAVAVADGGVGVAVAAGGVAVAVASDEVARRGVNQWKRRRLIEAGADVVIPEYRKHAQLLDWLFER